MQNQKTLWNNIAKKWEEFRSEMPARHTLEFLKNKSGKILDLGAGSGRHMIKLKKTKFYLQDFSSEMLKIARLKAKKQKINAEFICSDLTKIPIKDSFFDYAICISSLHCVKGKQNRIKVIKELSRVLKNGSQAEIAVWNKDSKRFKKSPKEKLIGWQELGKRYYYLYEPKEIYDLFQDNGFKIIYKEDPARMIVFIVEKV